jgi:hypothetical protein
VQNGNETNDDLPDSNQDLNNTANSTEDLNEKDKEDLATTTNSNVETEDN